VIPAASISYTNSAGDLFNMNSSSMELEVREEGQTINASNITSAAQQYVENGVLQHHEAGAGSNYLLPGNATYLWAVFAALLAFIYILLDKIL
ncbi:MAG TPA: hypothetical protein VN455_13140, partial [Methanotrichaceae archaeon]|nr:hypothetical protein [Methanotrichaceae archaeon]